MTNWNWKFVRIGSAAVALALMVTASVMAFTGHENTLTFSRPVALPGGVVLPAGTYSFDVAADTAIDVVVVRDPRRTKLFYMGFTTTVSRPAGMSPNTSIAVGEAPASQAPPIATWYEIGHVMGHEFRY